MILHGVPSWDHKQGDSLRDPRHLNTANRLKQFDRIIMNPPFSLEDWGYDTLSSGDKFGRLSFGMPPASNGDWAWMQQIVHSLKDYDPDTGEAGKGMVVMSQGVLFRGQPEQTEEEDGVNQKADAEHVIRQGFVESDLIECIVVLPSKLFYGNGVPACLVLLNKNKPQERKGKILMIWASRHFQKANPQNLLRPSDLMRILVPWRAFGDLEQARSLVESHAEMLIREVEENRDQLLADIENVFGQVLAPLDDLVAEQSEINELDLKVASVYAAVSHNHKWFGPLAKLKDELEKIKIEIKSAGHGEKAALKPKLAASKKTFDATRKKLVDAIKAHQKQLNKAVKELNKLKVERDAHEQEIRLAADRNISQLDEATDDIRRILNDPEEAKRYFVVADTDEIIDNEFNLNMPRYVDTFEPEAVVPFDDAIRDLEQAELASTDARNKLKQILDQIGSISV